MKKDNLSKSEEEILEKSAKRFKNFMIFTSWLLIDLGIKPEEVISNKQKMITKLEQKYPKNPNLIEVVRISMNLWTPPTNNLMKLSDLDGIKKNSPRSRIKAFINYFQDSTAPSPEYCKKFLQVKQFEPSLDEVSQLFLNKLAKIGHHKEKQVVGLFQSAIKELEIPIDTDDYIRKSRYQQILFGNIEPVSENFSKIINRIMKQDETLSQLDDFDKKLVANETVDILFNLLEGSFKKLLWVIFNLKRIAKNKGPVPLDRTLGEYMHDLQFKNKTLNYLRRSLGHKNYEIQTNPISKEINVNFLFKKRKYRKFSNIKKSFKELFSFIQRLNASISIFKMYMESYIKEYKYIKEYNKSIEDVKKEYNRLVLDFFEIIEKIVESTN